MKNRSCSVIISTILVGLVGLVGLPGLSGGAAHAQEPVLPPFYQIYGGLFFPDYKEYEQMYNASSDFYWGMAMGLPVSADFFYIIGEWAVFNSQGFTSAVRDTSTELTIVFWHAGVMAKHFLAERIALRYQLGLNYNVVKQSYSHSGVMFRENSVPKGLGAFIGLGFERFVLGGQLSFFADFLYDYRRSEDPAIYGDFGGIRIAAGASLYWF
jgi:hypothetical protein